MLVSARLSLTDGWLPDITHSVRRPLILNITALALLFMLFPCKPGQLLSLNQKNLRVARVPAEATPTEMKENGRQMKVTLLQG